MLTIFATPKPFKGHDGIIQRNAIGSWVRLHPDCEVILFGDETGTAEVAEELGARHVPHVLRSEFGTKRLDYMFACAQEMAKHGRVCYANSDMILLPSFSQAVDKVKASMVRVGCSKAQAAPIAVCLYRTLTSRQTKK